jgi:hypothetical protein
MLYIHILSIIQQSYENFVGAVAAEGERSDRCSDPGCYALYVIHRVYAG